MLKGGSREILGAGWQWTLPKQPTVLRLNEKRMDDLDMDEFDASDFEVDGEDSMTLGNSLLMYKAWMTLFLEFRG